MNKPIIIIGKNTTSLMLAAVLLKQDYLIHIIDNGECDYSIETIKINRALIDFLKATFGNDFIEHINQFRALLNLDIQDGYWHLDRLELDAFLERTVGELYHQKFKRLQAPFILNITDKEIDTHVTITKMPKWKLDIDYKGQRLSLDFMHIVDASHGFCAFYQKFNQILGDNKVVYKSYINEALLESSPIFKPCYAFIQRLITESKDIASIKRNVYRDANVDDIPEQSRFSHLGWDLERIPCRQMVITPKGLFYGVELPLSIYELPESSPKEINTKQEMLKKWLYLTLKYEVSSHTAKTIISSSAASSIHIYQNLIDLYEGWPHYVHFNKKSDKLFLTIGSKLLSPDIYTGLAEEIKLDKLLAIANVLTQKVTADTLNAYTLIMDEFNQQMWHAFNAYVFHMDDIEYQSNLLNSLLDNISQLINMPDNNKNDKDRAVLNTLYQRLRKVCRRLAMGGVGEIKLISEFEEAHKQLNNMKVHSLADKIKILFGPSHFEKKRLSTINFLQNAQSTLLKRQKHMKSQGYGKKTHKNIESFYNEYLSHGHINQTFIKCQELHKRSLKKVMYKLSKSYVKSTLKKLNNDEVPSNFKDFLYMFTTFRQNHHIYHDACHTTAIKLNLYKALMNECGLKQMVNDDANQDISQMVKDRLQIRLQIQEAIDKEHFQLLTECLNLLNVIDSRITCSMVAEQWVAKSKLVDMPNGHALILQHIKNRLDEMGIAKSHLCYEMLNEMLGNANRDREAKLYQLIHRAKYFNEGQLQHALSNIVQERPGDNFKQADKAIFDKALRLYLANC